MWISIEPENLIDEKADAIKRGMLFKCQCGDYMTRFDQQNSRMCIDCQKSKGIYQKKTPEEVFLYNRSSKTWLGITA